MKNLKIYYLIGLFISSFLSIQAQGSSSVEEFEVEGIKVILKHSPKEVVSAKMFIKGGTANYTKEKEGIESFALSLAVSGGTTTKDKIAFSSAREKMSANIGSSTTYDYGQVSLRCVKQFWNESWNLFTDAILNPAFTETEYALLKEQLINNVKQNASDPDNQLRTIAMSNFFKGKNYAKVTSGTEESLQNITLDEIKEYYANLIGKKRISFVVVGDIDKKDISEKIKSAFASLKEGALPTLENNTEVTPPTTVIEDRDIATNYIMGQMDAPKMDSKEGVAMRIAMSVLRDRLFIEIRTKRGLSYAPSSFYANGIVENPYNAIYVTTINPKESMRVMVDEIDKLRTVGYSAKELTDVKQGFLTSHYMGLETMASQSRNLGLADLKGNWEMAEEFANIVNDISLDDINNAIKKYTDNITWTYLGKKDMVNEEDFVQPKPIKKEVPIKN